MIVGVTEMPSPTGKSGESFYWINGLFWASVHYSFVYLFISLRKYLAHGDIYMDVRSASAIEHLVMTLWGLQTQ